MSSPCSRARAPHLGCMLKYVLLLTLWAGSLMADPLSDCADTGFSRAFHNKQQGATDRIGTVLDARRTPGACTVTVSGQADAYYMLEQTDTAGKFPMLGRFPDQHTQGQTHGQQLLIPNAEATVLLAPADVLSVVGQVQYTDLAYPGQERLRLPQAWAIVGNREASPFYAAVGKGVVPFGDFTSYLMFNRPVTSHAFQSETQYPMLVAGYDDGRTQFVVSGLSGKREQRVAFGHNDKVLGNYAVRASRVVRWSNTRVKVGGSYLNDSIYDSPITHHTGKMAKALKAAGVPQVSNPVYGADLTLSHGPFDLHAEYMRTEQSWLASGAPVIAWAAEGRYRFVLVDKDAYVAAGYGRSSQGDDGTAWEMFTQNYLTAALDLNSHVTVAAELVFNHGFVPLINITHTSVEDVDAQALLLGVQARF